MEFTIRTLTEKDYVQTLTKWWNDWNWSAPPIEALPSNGEGGFMVSKGGQDICAGFLYFTNSSLAWLEFIVSNKEYKDKDRAEAILFLIDNLCLAAKENGYKAIWTCVKHPNLIKKYEASGFTKTDLNATEMIKQL
jgi:hypothetical protein